MGSSLIGFWIKIIFFILFLHFAPRGTGNNMLLLNTQNRPTQSRLAHHILQGVEYASPTGWSDSHLSIGDKYVWLFNEQLLFSITCLTTLYDNSVTYISKNSVTFTTFQMHKIRLSTMYTFAVLRTARSH